MMAKYNDKWPPNNLLVKLLVKLIGVNKGRRVTFEIL